MKKDAFSLRKTFLKPISNLSDAQLGNLFRAIYQYQCGETPEPADDVAVYFSFFVAEFEEEEAKRRKRAENAAERRRKKLAEANTVAEGNAASGEATSASDKSQPQRISLADYQKKISGLKAEYTGMRNKFSKVFPKIYKSGLSKLTFDEYSILRRHISDRMFESDVHELARSYDPQTSDMTFFQAMMQKILIRR